MLLHRYGGNIDFILQLPALRGLELIQAAEAQERETRIFQQWVSQLPVMALTGETESFSDYRARVTGAGIDLRPTAVIMAELDAAEAEMAERSCSNGT